MWQRSELWLPDRADRFIQHHLDDFGGAMLILGVVGMVTAVLLGRIFGKSTILFWGALSAVTAVLMMLFMPL